MKTWKHVLILSALMFGMTSMCEAETTLIIATSDYPPYVSERPEDSFLTAIFHAVGKEMGVIFTFTFLPWKRCEIAVENLDAWGAIPYSRTPEREKIFYFSDYLYVGQTLFFAYSPEGRKPQIPYTKLTDLKSYRIGGVIGYYYESWFRDAGLNVEYVASEEQNFRKLQRGRIDLFPVGEGTGWYRIKELFPPEEVEKFFTLSKPLRAGGGDFLMTSKEYPESQTLLNRFNAALKTIKDTGVYQQILDRYGIVVTY
jgi:polar amino acid transport system substrate-binding protein